MPDLKNSYIYKDWIMSLEYPRVYHQCQRGVIHTTHWEDDRQYARLICNNCDHKIPEDILQHLRATWKLVRPS